MSPNQIDVKIFRQKTGGADTAPKFGVKFSGAGR